MWSTSRLRRSTAGGLQKGPAQIDPSPTPVCTCHRRFEVKRITRSSNREGKNKRLSYRKEAVCSYMPACSYDKSHKNRPTIAYKTYVFVVFLVLPSFFVRRYGWLFRHVACYPTISKQDFTLVARKILHKKPRRPAWRSSLAKKCVLSSVTDCCLQTMNGEHAEVRLNSVGKSLLNRQPERPIWSPTN